MEPAYQKTLNFFDKFPFGKENPECVNELLTRAEKFGRQRDSNLQPPSRDDAHRLILSKAMPVLEFARE